MDATVAETFKNAAVNKWDFEKHSLSEAQPESHISIRRVQFEPEGNPGSAVRTGDRVTMSLSLDAESSMKNIKIGVSIFSQQEVILIQSLVEMPQLKAGMVQLECRLDPLPLRAGSYPVQIRIHDELNCCLAVIDRKDFLLRVEKPEGMGVNSLSARATSIIDLDSAWEDPVEVFGKLRA